MWFGHKTIGTLFKALPEQVAPLFVLLYLSGCASPGPIKVPSPVQTGRPVSMNKILVATTSAVAGLEIENNTLNSAILSGLKETKMFGRVTGDQADLGSEPGIKVKAEIRRIKKVSEQARQWTGGLAGRASLEVRVTIADLNSGELIECFEAHGESGASAFAGTTDEAIQRAAEQIVVELLKLNAESS
jgi:hypothetical protein